MTNFNEPEEMPLGLMMQLGTDPSAMNYFANLSDSTKNQLIDYIRGATTGDDAKARIDQVMQQLHNHEGFF